MSGGKSLTMMALRECKACRDVKYEQWFPAEGTDGVDMQARQGSICMVCSTAEGVEQVNRQTSESSAAEGRKACAAIQKQIQSRLMWASNIRSRSEEQAREMEKMAASVYKRLGEADREMAGLRKLQERNLVFMSELESAQWRNLHGAEEDDNEEVEEPPEKRLKKEDNHKRTTLEREESEKPKRKKGLNFLAEGQEGTVEKLVEVCLPPLCENAGKRDGAVYLEGGAEGLSEPREGSKQRRTAADGSEKEIKETKQLKELVDQERMRAEKHEHQIQEWLYQMAQENSRVVASMQMDLQDCKQQWKMEWENLTARVKEGGFPKRESLLKASAEKLASEAAKQKVEWCVKKMDEMEERHAELSSKVERLVQFIAKSEGKVRD